MAAQSLLQLIINPLVLWKAEPVIRIKASYALRVEDSGFLPRKSRKDAEPRDEMVCVASAQMTGARPCLIVISTPHIRHREDLSCLKTRRDGHAFVADRGFYFSSS